MSRGDGQQEEALVLRDGFSSVLRRPSILLRQSRGKRDLRPALVNFECLDSSPELIVVRCHEKSCEGRIELRSAAFQL